MNIIKRFAYNHVIPAIGHMVVGKNKWCNVIYYHDIVKDEGYSFMRTNLDVFKRQMQFIADNGYETLRFADLGSPDKMSYKKKRVIIVFDDGWLSNYTEIFDYMKSMGLKYNVFLAVGLIGEDDRYLTWDMVREMHESGICGFGTHTYSHVDLSKITPQVFAGEVEKADERFSSELGYSPKDFCYPFGKYSAESNDYLTEHSQYERIYLSDMRYSYKTKGRYIMGRNGISNDEAFSVFKAKLNGYFNILSLITR